MEAEARAQWAAHETASAPTPTGIIDSLELTLAALERRDAHGAAQVVNAAARFFNAGAPGLREGELDRALELHARCSAAAARLYGDLAAGIGAAGQSRKAQTAYGR